MELNADFSKRVLIHSQDLPWAPSPMAGVDRRPLDRIGDEVARATSIVRYAPGSAFSAHTHHGGEEFIVLDGVFQDEHGDYPAGTYVRNPVGTSHTPGSAPGTTIFVKLWQFAPADQEQIRVDMSAVTLAPETDRAGVKRAVLFSNDEEIVSVEEWAPGTSARWQPRGGAEILVLDGSAEADGEKLSKGSWLRVPADDPVSLVCGEAGLRFWIKTGHLRHIRRPPGE